MITYNVSDIPNGNKVVWIELDPWDGEDTYSNIEIDRAETYSSINNNHRDNQAQCDSVEL